MVQRTTPQFKTDDNSFPIRVKLRIPFEDRARWWELQDRLNVWLREIGPLRCVSHSAWSARDQALALYFRTLNDAQACLAAFPEFELADGGGGGDVLFADAGGAH